MDYMNENKGKKMNIKSLISKDNLYYFLTFLVILMFSFSILYLFGLVPTEFNTIIGRYPDQESTHGQYGELPLSIKIPEVGVDAQVYNPGSTSTEVLDNYLAKGAIRYPGSGLLGTSGNVLLLGHSTSFKVVINQAYKTFVGLKNLKNGDLASVFSGSYEYVYKVDSVKMEEASNVRIDFDTNGRKLLTLVTCNTSVASKEARYIVVAEFVNRKSIK
jgi:LPXTG-site transpeptidase (sortase) family protein